MGRGSSPQKARPRRDSNDPRNMKPLQGTASGDLGRWPDLDQRGSINVDPDVRIETGRSSAAYLLTGYGRSSRPRIYGDRVRGVSPKPASTRLREPDGGDRPLSMVASDRDSQAVQFVKPNVVHCPGLSIGEDHGLADKLGLGLLELAQDRGCTDAQSWHG